MHWEGIEPPPLLWKSSILPLNYQSCLIYNQTLSMDYLSMQSIKWVSNKVYRRLCHVWI